MLAALLVAPGGATQGQEQSTQPIRIAVLNDQSSLNADVSGFGSVESVRMAVEDFGGKVLGRPIEVLFADHQNKSDVGAAIARRWIEVDHVNAIVDGNNSAVALAVQELVRNANRVFLMGGVATSLVTNENCSPNGFSWVFDTFALASSTGAAVVAEGGKSWYFLTANYAFGHSLERDASQMVMAKGGTVLGSARVPINSFDFSSYLLQAQASRAQIVALANTGGDLINSIKQAHEFGLTREGQRLVALLTFITDVHSLGLQTAQGFYLTTAFYWDYDDETRAFAKRFAARFKNRMPTMIQAGVYSAVSHYLKAMQAAGTDETGAVTAKMKSIPLRDFFARNGKIRDDGRVIHDMYLAQVKTPAESKGPWDYYKIVRTVPGNEAFNSLANSKCPLVKR
jgi:branched-chain amino acid transport system substrate-binding protein